jgi:hypothetical protein
MHDSLFKSVMAKQAGRHRMWPDAENQTIIKDWLCHALFFEHETEDVENFFFFFYVKVTFPTSTDSSRAIALQSLWLPRPDRAKHPSTNHMS